MYVFTRTNSTPCVLHFNGHTAAKVRMREMVRSSLAIGDWVVGSNSSQQPNVRTSSQALSEAIDNHTSQHKAQSSSSMVAQSDSKASNGVMLKCPSKCRNIVNVACTRAHHPFDRIINCLMPLYPALVQMLSAHPVNTTLPVACLVMPQGQATIGEYVNALFGTRSFHLLESPTGCATTESLKFSKPSLEVSRVLHAKLRGHWLPALQHAPYIVLAVRTISRAFRQDLKQLTRRLYVATRHEVRLYFGNESASETVSLFAGAAGMIGWHGAGFANAVFMPHGGCIIEIGTYIYEALPNRCEPREEGRMWNYTQKGGAIVMPWRSNRPAVQPWNTKLRWIEYKISLRQLLEANNWPCHALLPSAANFRDHKIKMLAWTILTDLDVDNIAAALEPCLAGRQRDAYNDDLAAYNLTLWSKPAPPPPPYSHLVGWNRLPAPEESVVQLEVQQRTLTYS